MTTMTTEMVRHLDIIMKIEQNKLLLDSNHILVSTNRRREIYNSISLICIMKKKIRFFIGDDDDDDSRLCRLPTELVIKIIEYYNL